MYIARQMIRATEQGCRVADVTFAEQSTDGLAAHGALAVLTVFVDDVLLDHEAVAKDIAQVRQRVDRSAAVSA